MCVCVWWGGGRFRHIPWYNGLQGGGGGGGGGGGNMLKIVRNIGNSRVGKFQYYFRCSNLSFSYNGNVLLVARYPGYILGSDRFRHIPWDGGYRGAGGGGNMFKICQKYRKIKGLLISFCLLFQPHIFLK